MQRAIRGVPLNFFHQSQGGGVHLHCVYQRRFKGRGACILSVTELICRAKETVVVCH